MRRYEVFLWLLTSIAYVLVAWRNSQPDFTSFTEILIFLDTPIFIFAMYLFWSIRTPKNRLKNFIKISHFTAPYFLSIFAVFNAFLLLVPDVLNKLGYVQTFLFWWYTFLSILYLTVAWLPTCKMITLGKLLSAKIWFVLITMIFGWIFSKLTGVMRDNFWHVSRIVDTPPFLFSNYLELAVTITLTVYFFRLSLKPFSDQ